MEWAKIVLQRDFSHKSLTASDDFDGIGASECRGQFNVTLYIYISREDDIAVFIQKLDGGAERAVTRSQGVAVKIEDGHGNRCLLVVVCRRSGILVSYSQGYWNTIRRQFIRHNAGMHTNDA